MAPRSIWLLRFLAGCALGLMWIASEIWMNNVISDGSRGAVMGIYGTVFSLGIVGGPILLEFTGTQGARPFVIGAICLMLTLLPSAYWAESEHGAIAVRSGASRAP